jgi:catechol 2,3-dioxygenase-like lactoylglutathione lyase family enzyme
METKFSRATLFCRNIERSLVLYRDILQLKVIDDKTIDGPAAGGLLGLGPCKLRIVLLGDSDSDSEWAHLGLFQISDTEISALPMPPNNMALGQNAIVFSTDDFDNVVARLQDTETIFLTEPVSYPKPRNSPGSPAGLYKEAICFDPDGHLVSIMQILPLASD